MAKLTNSSFSEKYILNSEMFVTTYLYSLCPTLKVRSYSWVITDHQTVQDVRGGVSWNLGQVFWRQLAVVILMETNENN